MFNLALPRNVSLLTFMSDVCHTHLNECLFLATNFDLHLLCVTECQKTRQGCNHLEAMHLDLAYKLNMRSMAKGSETVIAAVLWEGEFNILHTE